MDNETSVIVEYTFDLINDLKVEEKSFDLINDAIKLHDELKLKPYIKEIKIYLETKTEILRYEK